MKAQTIELCSTSPPAAMSGKGKQKLIGYVELTYNRLAKLSESGEGLDEEKRPSIVASVVNSVRRLCGGSPDAFRDEVNDAMDSAGCLDGVDPNPAAGLGNLIAAMEALTNLFGIAEEKDDEPPAVNIEAGDESATLAGVVDRLYEIEKPYTLKLGTDVILNAQHKADFDPVSADGRHVTDRATEPLFKHVDKSKLTPVDHAFIALLDNYNRAGDAKEVVTSQEKGEMDKFMDLMSETPHMRYVHKVLVKWGLAPAKLRDFMAKVYEAWFTNYYEGTSSGFEHVFVGEEKQNKETGRSEIIGLHNWLQFAREEARGNMNYLGYAQPSSEDGCIVTVKFAWTDDDPEVEVKTLSTMLVGTTIAFDFSLACLVFFGGKDGDRPRVKVHIHDVQIQLYKVTDRMGEYVRTVYIE